MREKKRMLATLIQRSYWYLMRCQMRNYASGTGMNLHRGQGRVLAILKIQPEIAQKELGYLLDMSKQALAELLNKLEKNGYITRVQSEKDRRSFVVKLTDKGRDAVPSENDESDDGCVEEFFDCLTDDEQDNLMNYMMRVIDVMDKKRGDDDDYADFFRKRFFAMHRGGGLGGFLGRMRGFDPRMVFGGFDPRMTGFDPRVEFGDFDPRTGFDARKESVGGDNDDK